MSRGRFITFEGGEGCGKSTQITLLVRTLEGRGVRVAQTREPGGTELGEAIRRWLLSPGGPPLSPPTEVLLFAAARAQLVAEVAEPALAAGTWVVSDRFLDSTTVYQSMARGLNRKQVDAINAMAVQQCIPDRTLVLAVPVELGLQRARAQQEFATATGDRIECETLAFHQAVYEGYHLLQQSDPKRIRLIDGTGSVDEVHARCWREVEPLLAAS